VDFSYPPEAEAFRVELRAWLAANLDERGHHLERLADATFAPGE